MTTEQHKGNNHAEVIQWGYDQLSSNRYQLTSDFPEVVQETPWSYVARFFTSVGYVYLKQTPKLLGLEAKIIHILHQEFHASVPRIIANNPHLNCFLMSDEGCSLRSMLKRKFDEDLVCKAITQFASTQLLVSSRIDVLIKVGVPDWQLDRFPALYQDLLLKKDMLIEDGLSEEDINKLNQLFSTVCDLCENLSRHSIKQTIVQPDCNDNNTLVNEHSDQMTIIDLGELSISHPFFSLHNFLSQMKKHHGLTEADSRYGRIKNAYFSVYNSCGSKQDLDDVFSMTALLFPIYWAFSQVRLMKACDPKKLKSVFPGQGRPSVSLKAFIDAF